MKVFVALVVLVASISAEPQKASVSGKSGPVPIISKAPSNLVNCNCQCDNYTWRDSYGKIQGNCKSADNTNARWCYVPNRNSCNDLRYSKNRRDSYGNIRRWSYEACSTPARNSYQCRNNNYGNNNNYNNGGFNNNNGYNNGFNNNNGYNNGFNNNGYNNGFNNNNGLSGNYNNGRPNRRPNRPNRRPNRPSYGTGNGNPLGLIGGIISGSIRTKDGGVGDAVPRQDSGSVSFSQ